MNGKTLTVPYQSMKTIFLTYPGNLYKKITLLLLRIDKCIYSNSTHLEFDTVLLFHGNLTSLASGYQSNGQYLETLDTLR